MTSPKEAFKAYNTAWNAHDLGALKATVTDDFVWDDRTAPGPVQGIEPVAQAFFTAFPDLVATSRQLYELPDRLIEEWTVVGTHKGPLMGVAATGKRIEIQGASVILVREGKIARETLYYDSAGVLRQLG